MRYDVTLIQVNSDTTTTVVVCPFSDPIAHGLSCLQEGFYNVQYNSMGPDPGTMPPSTQSPHQKRGAPVVTASVERGPDVPPPSTLDLSTEFVEYFCSENGRRMVDCAVEVNDKCTDHPSMHVFSFNPVQAAKARDMCNEVMPDYSKVSICLNKTALTDEFLSCASSAYEKYSKPGEQESYITARCKATADAYNCYTTIGERFCDKRILDFSVALMRFMEDRYCTPIVDRVFIAAVSAATLTSTTLVSIATVTFIISSVL